MTGQQELFGDGDFPGEEPARDIPGDTPAPDHADGGDWLHTFIEYAVRKRMCTRVGCTTCGALQFRHGVLEALSAVTGRPPRRQMSVRNARELLTALRYVGPHEAEPWEFESAVRLLIMEISWTLGGHGSEPELESALEGTWAGELLWRMKMHYEARQAAYRARKEYESAESTQKRKEEKKRTKQEKHQQRLAEKAERDRLWYEQHGKTDTE